MAIDQQRNVELAALTIDTHTYTGTIACRDTIDAVVTGTIVVEGDGHYGRRINNIPGITERLPSIFFGIVEIDGTSLDVDNLDGALSRLRGEEIRGKPVRIRRYDQLSHEIVDVAHLLIEGASVGQTIPVDLVSHDLDVFQQNLPRNLIGFVAQTDVNGNQILENETEPNQLSSQFPKAVDIGAPINIVFGQTTVRCGFCADNSDAIDPPYAFADYLIGEGTIDVQKVYKNSAALQNGAGVVIATSLVRVVSEVTSDRLPNAAEDYVTHVTFPDWDDNGKDQADPKNRMSEPKITYFDDAGSFTMWLNPLTGNSAGKWFRITASTNPATHNLASTVDVQKSDPATGPEVAIDIAPGDLIRLQEWAPLVNTEYKGRTAVRFGRRQDDNAGNHYLITADVARYRPARKNFLRDTDGFDPNDKSLFVEKVTDPAGGTKVVGYTGGPDTSGAWIHNNTTFKGAFVDIVVPGPDDVSNSTRVKFDAAGSVQQSVDVGVNGGSWTFSIWIRTDTETTPDMSIELFSTSGTGTATKATFAYDSDFGGKWQRISVTKVNGWGTGTSATVRVNSPSGGWCWLWGAQLEKMDSFTGAGTIESASTVVTGTGTAFTTEILVGDVIVAAGQYRTVASITSDTQLSTSTAFSPVIDPGTSFTVIRTAPSWYEACGHGEPAGRHWSIPDAVQELLADTTWGLGQIVAASTFEDANRDLFLGLDKTQFPDNDDLPEHDWLFLRCQGAIPDLSGQTSVAKDVLDEILQLRGLWLDKHGAAWRLHVDCPRNTSQATFGTVETPYANVFDSGDSANLGRTGLSDTSNQLRAAYGQSIGTLTKGGDAHEYFPFVQTFPYQKPGADPPPGPGQPKLYNLHFVRDHNTAARFLQYTAGALQLLGLTNGIPRRGSLKHSTQQLAQISVGDEGRNLRVGHLVTYIAPPSQPENLLKYSEDLTQAAWTTSGSVTRTAREARDPENLNWTGTKVVLASGATIQQITNVAAQTGGVGQHAIGYVWLKGDRNKFITVTLACGNQSFLHQLKIGDGWRRVRVEGTFTSAATGNIRLIVGNSLTSITTYVWGAQIVLDYDKEYAPTTDEPLPATTLYRLHELSRSDVDNSALTLSPYDIEDLFTYVKPPAFPTRDEIPLQQDPRTVGPALVQLSTVRVPVEGDSNVGIASMGVDTRGTVTTFWAKVDFIMPLANPDDLTTNVTKVVVQVSKASNSGDSTDEWWDAATVYAKDVALGTTATVTLHNLMPETKYTIRFASVNAYGVDDITADVKFTTMKDPNA